MSEAPPEIGEAFRGFLWSATSVEELGVIQRDDFYITDADFMSGHDLLLLERRSSPASDIAMQIRRIDASAIKPHTIMDGEIVLRLDNRSQIDNMEGLSVFTAPNGSTRIGLVSDDNHWPLQRTLYLEFEFSRYTSCVMGVIFSRFCSGAFDDMGVLVVFARGGRRDVFAL